MKFHFVLLVILAAISLMNISAFGSPEPNRLVVQDQDTHSISIEGSLFGEAPELGGPALVADSVSGLKSCVVLGEAPVFTSCATVKVLPVTAWNVGSVTALIGEPDPEGPQQMYIYLIDNEGAASLPIGPVDMENGFANATSALVMEEVEYGETGTVEVLQLKVLGPGQPGPPIRN